MEESLQILRKRQGAKEGEAEGESDGGSLGQKSRSRSKRGRDQPWGEVTLKVGSPLDPCPMLQTAAVAALFEGSFEICFRCILIFYYPNQLGQPDRALSS